MNSLDVLYEDNHIIVVLKKANILSQADSTRDIDMLTIVKKYIKEKYNKPGNVYLGLIHRLDRPVGGIMVFARTSKAASRLSEQVRNKKFKKSYMAVVHGKLPNDKDIFIDYLKKLDNGNTIVTDERSGKYSELSYEVVSYNKKEDMSLVNIDLKTGRHHQIRVQFSSRGYPLCGDQRYGKQDNTQIALYAYKLEFIHPTTKEKMVFEKRPNNNLYFSKFEM